MENITPKTVKEAATLLNITKGLIYYWINDGLISKYSIPNPNKKTSWQRINGYGESFDERLYLKALSRKDYAFLKYVKDNMPELLNRKSTAELKAIKHYYFRTSGGN